MNNPKPVNKIEVADIFRAYSGQYVKSHGLPYNINKVIRNIVNCRTAFFGGHKQACNECSHIDISYNSCGDRNCPKCGMLTKEKWLGARKEELLPVPYYHIVFTLPELLNPLMLNNPQKLYNILFKAAKETLIKLGKDHKHLGANIGLIAVLHTWGQNLSFHPHLHIIVPGGGLSEDGRQWLYPKKSKKNKKFFVHVNVISSLFKKIFLYYLNREHKSDNLKGLSNNSIFNTMLNKLYKAKWVTYCKKPFGGPEQVLEYIGRYTHRTAISNNRIIKMENGMVYFKWRDYKDANINKIMKLTASEFIRRFMMHILPSGFFRIRYFGFLASRLKKEMLGKCRRVLKATSKPQNHDQNMGWQERLFKLTGLDILLCPKCKKGRMYNRQIIQPLRVTPRLGQAAPT